MLPAISVNGFFLKNKFDSTKDNPHIATTETPAIAMLTSKFSTTNHIIELFVALVHKPKTTSSIIKINIVANPALTPNE